MNTCARCETVFQEWTEYQEHVSLFCTAPKIVRPIDEILATRLHVPAPIKLQEWKGPMDPALKAMLVARGEMRLGVAHFIGKNVGRAA